MLISSPCEFRPDLQVEAMQCVTESVWKTSQSGRGRSTQRHLFSPLWLKLSKYEKPHAGNKQEYCWHRESGGMDWKQTEAFFFRVTNFKHRKSAEASPWLEGLMHFLFKCTSRQHTHLHGVQWHKSDWTNCYITCQGAHSLWFGLKFVQ